METPVESVTLTVFVVVTVSITASAGKMICVNLPPLSLLVGKLEAANKNAPAVILMPLFTVDKVTDCSLPVPTWTAATHSEGVTDAPLVMVFSPLFSTIIISVVVEVFTEGFDFPPSEKEKDGAEMVGAE